MPRNHPAASLDDIHREAARGSGSSYRESAESLLRQGRIDPENAETYLLYGSQVDSILARAHSNNKPTKPVS